MQLLDRLMPFHLCIDDQLLQSSAEASDAHGTPNAQHGDLRITRMGPLLRRIAPKLKIGDAFASQFELQPSQQTSTFAAVEKHLVGRLTILRLDTPYIQIRGCFVPLPNGKELLFAGSLWVTDLDRLSELGLAGSMLPPNDPLIDLLMTHRLMMTAQESSQRAAASAQDFKAQGQITLLEQVNQRLEEAVRERTSELERANIELRGLLAKKKDQAN